MKKLFSIVLMAALLVTCIAPALYSSAADLPSFVVESAEYEETTNSVDVSIGIADNPGIVEMKVLLYYLESEISYVDFAGGDVFVDGEKSGEGLSNSRSYRSYFPVEEFGDTVYEVKEFTLYAPADDDETGNGTFLNLSFDLVGDHSEGKTFTYGVKVKSAVNAADEEVTFAGKQEGTLTFTRDPYKDVYSNFTVFPTDATVDLDAKEATVDIRFVNNSGIFAFGIFIVYDDALTLKKITPVDGIFDIGEGSSDTVEINENPMVPPAEYGPDGILRALESKGISPEDKLVIKTMWMGPTKSEVNKVGDGPIARLTFELPENMQQGDSFQIDVCWSATDATAYVDGKTTVDPIGTMIDNGVGHIQTAVCEHKNVVLDVVKEATCSETGLKSGVCPECGLEVTEVIPMIEHTPGEAETKAPTCTEAGRIITKCTVCGTVISDVEDTTAGALGHDEENTTVKVVKEATCTEKGSQEVICGRCNGVIRTEEIAMIAHTEKVETKAPTCTEAGRIITICSVCGTEISNVEDTANPALGHTEGATVTKAPTCTEAGSQDIFCVRCETKLRTEEIPMIAHTEKVETKAPTCTEAGRIITTCSVCGTEISDVEDTANPALGHTYEVETIAPTCVDAGRIVEKCTVCGDVKSDVEDPDNPATGIHTPGEPEIVEPTATEDGSKTVKCTVCGEVISVEKIPAIGADTTAPSKDEDTTKAPADTTKPAADNKAPVKTGDNMVYVAVVAAIAVIGCAAVVVIRKRKVSEK